MLGAKLQQLIHLISPEEIIVSENVLLVERTEWGWRRERSRNLGNALDRWCIVTACCLDHTHRTLRNVVRFQLSKLSFHHFHCTAIPLLNFGDYAIIILKDSILSET